MAFVEFKGWTWPDDATQLLRTSILDVQSFKDAMAKHGGGAKDDQQEDFLLIFLI